jgi:hypothetical protein
VWVMLTFMLFLQNWYPRLLELAGDPE